MERTITALNSITDSFEIICVDDGSTDNSLTELVTIHKKDKRVKIISLARNFGHQAAFTAGLEHASGQYTAMMDGDLQDPPGLLIEMMKKAEEEGYDIVYGKRRERQEAFLKKLSISFFHYIYKKIFNREAVADAGNFSLMNRLALNALLAYKEKNRYLPGLRFFIGFRQGAVLFDREERYSGIAKMNFPRLLNLAFDAIFSFSDLPVKICLYLGLFGVISCFLAFIYVILSKNLHIAPFGWSSTTLSIFFIGFIQLVFLGIMGEYLFRVYRETQNRPIYQIRKIYE
jgi:dolichol-phosphate mannosyltransferase